MEFSLTQRESIVAAVLAGIAGAFALDAFLLIVPFPGTEYLGPLAYYTHAATILAGDAAIGAPWAVAVGLLGHIIIAVGWAFGYLYVARTRVQLIERPVISGIGFGIVVACITLATLALIGKYQPPTVHSIDRDLIAYTVFFGIPLALVVARFAPASARTN